MCLNLPPFSSTLFSTRLFRMVGWGLLCCLLFSSLALAQTDKDDNLTALPTTYSDILLETSPSGLPITLTQDNKPLSCLPANVTPCKFRVVAYKQVDLWIAVTYRNQILRYHRPLKGRTSGIQQWLLPMPLPVSTPLPTTQPTQKPPATQPTPRTLALPVPPIERRTIERRTVEPPIERRIVEPPIERRTVEPPIERRTIVAHQVPPQAPRKAGSASPLIWPWIVVGAAVVIGVGVGVGVGVAQQDRITLRCTACQK